MNVIESLIVISTASVIALTFISAGVLISSPSTTTAELWQQGESVCEASGGVNEARRYRQYLEVECVNGALFTIKGGEG